MSKVTIETREGCLLAKGELTLTACAGFTAMAPAGAVLDTDLARMAGVDLAAGLPADLGRCRRLLEAVPSLQAPFFARASALSPAWRRLVPEWNALCTMMDAEAPEWRDGNGMAPKTSARMKVLLDV